MAKCWDDAPLVGMSTQTDMEFVAEPPHDPLEQQGSMRFLFSREVMQLLRYQNRSAFWQFVYANGVPHVRLNARKIVFDQRHLEEWIRRRSAT